MTGGRGVVGDNDAPHSLRHLPGRIVRSASFYPLTGLYVGSVICLIGLMQGWLAFAEAALLLLSFTLLALMGSMHRELVNVTVILSEQRAQLIARVDELTRLLTELQQPVPPPTHTEEQARKQADVEDPEQTAIGVSATATETSE